MFIRASIEKKKSLFVARIVYSYWGLYHYSELNVFASLEECEHYLLYERCGGIILYDVDVDVEKTDEIK